MKAKTGLDMCGNEIANAVIENRTAAPENPKTGQFYYNTTHSRLYVYNGTDWEVFNPTQAFAFQVITQGVLTIQRFINPDKSPQVESVQIVDTSKFDSAGSAASAYASARTYVDNQISKLMGGAPSEALDTLFELAAAIEDNQDLIASLRALVSAGVHKKKVSCPALTPTSGVCTWVCNHGLTMETPDLICKVYTQSGEEVICDVTINSAANVIIKIASDTTIAAGSFYAVFIG